MSGIMFSQLQAKVAALLDAVAAEIALTARDIAELGEIVFTDNTIGDRHTRLRKLDAFGLLGEKCDANARLVQAAARVIAAPAQDRAGLLADAVSAMPLQMRERLEAALGGSCVAAAAQKAARLG
jgi:hypothetical protein